MKILLEIPCQSVRKQTSLWDNLLSVLMVCKHRFRWCGFDIGFDGFDIGFDGALIDGVLIDIGFDGVLIDGFDIGFDGVCISFDGV